MADLVPVCPYCGVKPQKQQHPRFHVGIYLCPICHGHFNYTTRCNAPAYYWNRFVTEFIPPKQKREDFPDDNEFGYEKCQKCSLTVRPVVYLSSKKGWRFMCPKCLADMGCRPPEKSNFDAWRDRLWRKDMQPPCYYMITCCALCGRPLQGDEHRHHVIPTNRGGTGNWSNIVGLCPSCHRKVHSQKGDITKTVFPYRPKFLCRLNTEKLPSYCQKESPGVFEFYRSDTQQWHYYIGEPAKHRWNYKKCPADLAKAIKEWVESKRKAVTVSRTGGYYWYTW